eukprot:Hpha_TRINITY_DN11400_c0_g1::TRINITY_DN11400_c0_g1_i1::g.137289::m.137289
MEPDDSGCWNCPIVPDSELANRTVVWAADADAEEDLVDVVLTPRGSAAGAVTVEEPTQQDDSDPFSCGIAPSVPLPDSLPDDDGGGEAEQHDDDWIPPLAPDDDWIPPL